MPIRILMPALSPTMTEGTLAKWLKKEGDEVKSGDVIAEIETDKATMEVEAVDEGRIAKILVAGGTQGVAVNTPIAILLEEGEDASALDAAEAAPKAAPAPAPTAAAAPATVAPAPAPAAAAHGGGSRVFASPLARRLAAQAGIELSAVKGSGPNGRIVKADVEAAKASGVTKAPAAAPAASPAPAPAAAPAPVPAAKPAGVDAKDLSDKLGMRYKAIPNTGMRKTIARRLSEAKQTVPHFYLTIDCQLDALLKVRSELNSRSDAYKLSVNDFVIRAVALALKKVPAANAAWTDEAILQYDHADVSVAVATPTGLITPIIKAAEGKGLAQISNEMKDLAKRARDGKLKPEEFQGGTFSVSNLGMFGIREFAAIINPPQGCILAVGAGEQRPIVKDGALAVATMMSCTLSVDHRVVDGAVGAEFLAAFKGLIEDPLSMLL
ncbi:pyruvate dehydrogenase E2 component (dihydrolipoamide acetyltransferase) [Azospirillum fermentarium]|uniref:pyruvate dehydrogenase complex dihydrolipoamide acetyltransferase n=1 Tax=Azospirillum fermentarium TaxID=1233114 RepID=UPI0022265033|nr:pyruvate dehydrogenase complex dihydrolipoamide acetyltransferase [Azospirillum fermentarium]MCW2246450.1 pyruvate dehydrogenase E2 component (dihydrolipoamide acetyltransferase) [Azospirillum fermentarium]